MGNPRKQRKKYESPRFPWRTGILQDELRLLGQYGLRNKRELWRHKTMLSKFRGIARSLIGKTPQERRRMEDSLVARLKKLGVIPETAVLDDVLDLSIEDILRRRLQTVVSEKGLANSVHQARQLINHGHIAVGDHRVTVPSYLVKTGEEETVTYASQSSIAIPTHPLRKTILAATPTETGTKVGEGLDE